MPSAGRKPRVLLAYFSYTGNTRLVAHTLSETLQGSCNVEIIEIVPRRRRSYLHWLAYSFIPSSEVDIENPRMDLSSYDAVLLGFPKWTFSCPPLNKFIHKIAGLGVPKFFLFMTSGGFGEERFLRSLRRRLTAMGCNVMEPLVVKRREIRDETYRASVDAFASLVKQRLSLSRDGSEPAVA